MKIQERSSFWWEILVIGMLLLTSCETKLPDNLNNIEVNKGEEDGTQTPTPSLEGTWKGNMYVSSEWNGRSYDAVYSEITFLKDPLTYPSGAGYWVDYYNNAPWGNYVANHIDWKVDKGIIYVYFREEGSSLEIRDYHLNYDRFWGYIYNHGTNVDFELYNVYHASYDYDDYYWGYW